MRHYALIGRSLAHSYSKRLFDAEGFPDADYRLHSMPSLDGMREWVRRDGIDGFNITNPYKQAVMALLDGVSPEARAIGAVNCVCVEDGRLTGHNTDAPAFRHTLESLLDTSHLSPDTACILGTGGAAHAVAYAMKLAPTLPKDKILVVNLSGRGDKDVAAIARYLGRDLHE